MGFRKVRGGVPGCCSPRDNSLNRKLSFKVSLDPNRFLSFTVSLAPNAGRGRRLDSVVAPRDDACHTPAPIYLLGSHGPRTSAQADHTDHQPTDGGDDVSATRTSALSRSVCASPFRLENQLGSTGPSTCPAPRSARQHSHPRADLGATRTPAMPWCPACSSESGDLRFELGDVGILVGHVQPLAELGRPACLPVVEPNAQSPDAPLVAARTP